MSFYASRYLYRGYEMRDNGRPPDLTWWNALTTELFEATDVITRVIAEGAKHNPEGMKTLLQVVQSRIASAGKQDLNAALHAEVETANDSDRSAHAAVQKSAQLEADAIEKEYTLDPEASDLAGNAPPRPGVSEAMILRRELENRQMRASLDDGIILVFLRENRARLSPIRMAEIKNEFARLEVKTTEAAIRTRLSRMRDTGVLNPINDSDDRGRYSLSAKGLRRATKWLIERGAVPVDRNVEGVPDTPNKGGVAKASDAAS